MKWTNPGHQLDEQGEAYCKVKRIYLFNTDEGSEEILRFLTWLNVESEFEITILVSKDHLEQGTPGQFCGRPVLSYDADLEEQGILPAMAEESVFVLPHCGQTQRHALLCRLGAKYIFFRSHTRNRRDNFIQNFLCIWLMYKHGRLLSHWTNYLVTSRCNLNCRDCLNYNPYIKAPMDVPFEEFKRNFDILFSKFDCLYSLHLTGGEPMLTKRLPEEIRYLAEHYRDRFFDFFVVTNAMVVPSEEVLSAIKGIGGHVNIDDYRPNVKNSRIDELIGKLEEYSIPYVRNVAEYWFDFRLHSGEITYKSEKELEWHKDDCNSFYHEFAGGKIFSCCWQEYAHRAGLAELDEGNDCIDISSTPKMEILEFRQGYTKKGYVEMCSYCRGQGSDACLTEPAVQVPRMNFGAHRNE